MIELRWKALENRTNQAARWKLQYRYRMPSMIAWHPNEVNKTINVKLSKWSDWQDVPYVPEEK